MEPRVLLVVVALLGVGALAPGSAAQAQPRAQPRPSATYFLGELELGASFTGDGGAAGAVTFGGGGMLRGSRLRFYLLGRAGFSQYGDDGRGALGSRRGHESGSFRDLALGPRVYVPLWGNLRWYVDGMVGASHASGSFTTAGGPSLQAYEWVWLINAGSGFQLRMSRMLSLGLRVNFAFNGDGLIGVMRNAGLHDPVRTAATGGVSWHF